MRNNSRLLLYFPNGDIVLDDFGNEKRKNCVNCISSNCGLRQHSGCNCPNGEGHCFLSQFGDGLKCLYICDNKEKTRKNAEISAVNLWHLSDTLCQVKHDIEKQAHDKISDEINAFKHNIEKINGDAIYELFALIPESRRIKNYKILKKSVKDKCQTNPDMVANYVARQALFNTSLQTEITVSKLIGEGRYAPTLTLSNPYDIIMSNIFSLYNDFADIGVEFDVDEFREQINMDFTGLKVAFFYLLQNATKYAQKKSVVKIQFKKEQQMLTIEVSMKSLEVLEDEADDIFHKGYRGIAVRATMGGQGLGLYYARTILSFSKANIILKPGKAAPASDGKRYANNVFIISLPLK